MNAQQIHDELTAMIEDSPDAYRPILERARVKVELRMLEVDGTTPKSLDTLMGGRTHAD